MFARLITPGLVACLALLSAGAAAADSRDWTTLERGYYLSRAGDCAACHTAEPGKPLAGNFALNTPFGTIYTANLTPDEETGLGSWTSDDFWRAMNEGRRRNGDYLYPAFPYTHFTIVTRSDSDALFAYLQRIEPVRQIVREPDFIWPLNWRFVMAGWNLINFEPVAFQPDPKQSPEWNRGKYLVEGLAHCGMCHSPKSFIGAEDRGDGRFTGGMAEGWWAPSLTRAQRDGIGSWSKQDLVRFLKDGGNEHSAAFGPMADVIQDSTRHLSEDDLGAIAEYLFSLPAGDPVEAERVSPLSLAMRRGQLIYETQCSACHAPDGTGVAGQFASLDGSGVVQASDPTTLVRAILEGVRATATDKFPTQHAMPSFAWKLTDEDVAAIATYVRNAFGNAAAAVSAGKVADLRERH